MESKDNISSEMQNSSSLNATSNNDETNLMYENENEVLDSSIEQDPESTLDWDDFKSPTWRKIGGWFIDFIVVGAILSALVYFIVLAIGGGDFVKKVSAIPFAEALLFWAIPSVAFHYLCSKIADRSLGEIIFGTIRLGSDNDLENVPYNDRRYRVRYEKFKQLNIPGHKKNEKLVLLISIAVLLLTIGCFYFASHRGTTVENDFFKVSASDGYKSMIVSQFEPAGYSVVMGKDPESVMTISTINIDMGDAPLENLIYNQIEGNPAFQNADSIALRDTTFLSYKAVVADVLMNNSDSYKVILFRNNKNMVYYSVIHNMSQQQMERLSQGIELKNPDPQYTDLKTFMQMCYNGLYMDLNKPINDDLTIVKYSLNPESKSFNTIIQITSASKEEINKEVVRQYIQDFDKEIPNIFPIFFTARKEGYKINYTITDKNGITFLELNTDK